MTDNKTNTIVYRVTSTWENEMCEPNEWEFATIEEAMMRYDACDPEEIYKTERNAQHRPWKFDKTACVSIDKIKYDENGYANYLDTVEYKQYGIAEFKREEEERRTHDVFNDYDIEIDFDAARMLMDDEIYEKLHKDNFFETNQEFFDTYCEKHLDKFGTEWELNKPSPVW